MDTWSEVSLPTHSSSLTTSSTSLSSPISIMFPTPCSMSTTSSSFSPLFSNSTASLMSLCLPAWDTEELVKSSPPTSFSFLQRVKLVLKHSCHTHTHTPTYLSLKHTTNTCIFLSHTHTYLPLTQSHHTYTPHINCIGFPPVNS